MGCSSDTDAVHRALPWPGVRGAAEDATGPEQRDTSQTSDHQRPSTFFPPFFGPWRQQEKSQVVIVVGFFFLITFAGLCAKALIQKRGMLAFGPSHDLPHTDAIRQRKPASILNASLTPVSHPLKMG